MRIRSAQIADAKALHDLNTDVLGHPYDLEKMNTQFQRLLGLQHHILLVAEDSQTLDVLGYIHAEVYETLYFPALLNVLALAVKSEHHRQGIGRKLLVELEKLARESGFSGIRINSGHGRTEAHAFYQDVGYQDVVLQKRFLKFLHP